jgi:uncharacterized membrane protein YagU involved in acid resistance
MQRRASILTVLIGGLIAGTFDLLYATGFSALDGVAPSRVLQSVASGLLGSAAYDGGAATAALGVILHYAMSLLIAMIFYALSRHLPLLIRHPLPWGCVFGLLVYAAMNFVVLPLSAFPGKFRFDLVLFIEDLIAHALLFGVPIALATRKAAQRALAPASAS